MVDLREGPQLRVFLPALLWRVQYPSEVELEWDSFGLDWIGLDWIG